MGKIVKKYDDGSYLEFDKGGFDDWCVYFVKSDGSRTAPTDTGYFNQLKQYAAQYGAEKVYNDFVSVYNSTGKNVEQTALDKITQIASSYKNKAGDALEMDIVFTILYMAMIAEENKQYTKLGKRIKRLGVHMVLVENVDVTQAATCMNGKKWQEIDRMCKDRGF
ncbi:MAG: hypothetical protein J1F42_07940 [Lachnospiraceae bacterium]|nr:hypothetical protein [Lachnospiraceae bacterium]